MEKIKEIKIIETKGTGKNMVTNEFKTKLTNDKNEEMVNLSEALMFEAALTNLLEAFGCEQVDIEAALRVGDGQLRTALEFRNTRQKAVELENEMKEKADKLNKTIETLEEYATFNDLVVNICKISKIEERNVTDSIEDIVIFRDKGKQETIRAYGAMFDSSLFTIEQTGDTIDGIPVREAVKKSAKNKNNGENIKKEKHSKEGVESKFISKDEVNEDLLNMLLSMLFGE